MTESLGALVRGLRLDAGLSQRALARRAGTSQPAIARYEGDEAAPSWATLQRLAAACGRRLDLRVEVRPDPGDVELARQLLDLPPLERLRSLRGFARLRGLAEAGR
jgi:transcriptional regulator with XRE-family HTH domain